MRSNLTISSVKRGVLSAVVVLSVLVTSCFGDAEELERQSEEELRARVPIAISAASDGSISIHFPPCEPYDRILTLGVSVEMPEYQRVWSIVGSIEDPAPLTSLQIGMVPPGFSEATGFARETMQRAAQLNVSVVWNPHAAWEDDLNFSSGLASVTFSKEDLQAARILIAMAGELRPGSLQELEEMACG